MKKNVGANLFANLLFTTEHTEHSEHTEHTEHTEALQYTEETQPCIFVFSVQGVASRCPLW